MILRGLGRGSGQPRMPDGLVVLRTGPGAPEPIIDILSSLGLSGALDPSTTTRRALGVIVEDAMGLWEDRLPDPKASKLQARLGLPSADLAFLWAGLGAREPVAALHHCVELCARWGGIDSPDRGSPTQTSSPEPALVPSPARARERLQQMNELATRVRELEGVPEELLMLESELRDLRADAVEATGDAEAQTVEWLRERQAAESELFAYRDRARELKIRLRQMEASGAEGDCPTCGRPLAEHFEQVLVTFREEWESVVQDGSWWKKRREQLELKPDALKALEGRTLRLHAAIETTAEKLERRRGALEELGAAQKRLEDLKRRLGGVGGSGSLDADSELAASESPQGLPLPDAPDRVRIRLTERPLRLASRWVNLISGGRYGGLDHRDGRVVLIRDGSSVPVSTGGDQAMVSIALRVAAVRLALEAEVPLGSVAFSDLEALGAEGRTRALTAFRGLLPDLRQVVVSSRVGPGIDRGPYDAAFMFSQSREGGARLTPVHEGPGAIHIAGLTA